MPGTNKTIGQKIVMLDTKTGKLDNFISLKKPDPNFRPVGIAFSNDANTMYIASLGKQEVRNTLPNGMPLPIPQTWVYQHTGIIWKVTKNISTSQPQPQPQPHPKTALPALVQQQQQKIALSPKDFQLYNKFRQSSSSYKSDQYKKRISNRTSALEFGSSCFSGI